jgi:hypothetical protein
MWGIGHRKSRNRCRRQVPAAIAVGLAPANLPLYLAGELELGLRERELAAGDEIGQGIQIQAIGLQSPLDRLHGGVYASALEIIDRFLIG